MFKVLWLLKPADGVSRERFHDWYENVHAPLAQRHFGHLLLEYRRNYVDGPLGAVADDHGGVMKSAPDESAAAQSMTFEYEVIAEWVVANEAAFEEIMRMFSDPHIGALFRADSEGTMHPATVLVKVTTHETVLGRSLHRTA